MRLKQTQILCWSRALRVIGSIATAVTLAACGGGGGGSASGDGSVRLAMTDAPSCGYDHVYVTVEKIGVHQSATASDTDAGWTDLTLAPAKQLDLLSLTNGVLEELGTLPLAAGHYSQIRLVLASNATGGASSMANAVQPTGGVLTALSTPSGQQSGLKLQANFDVAANQMSDLVLDFDACRSIVKAGNSGKYNLKPVIAVLPRTVTDIQGFVATTLSLSSTTVAAQQGGVTVRSTVPDGSGKFNIPYLPPGNYTLVISAEGRATAVVTGVPAGTTTTVINSLTTAISPPASAMADVTGTVTTHMTTGSATQVVSDASVRALQALTGGPTIELGDQAVDAELGTYRLHLPVAAPVKAAYATASPLSFAADATAAGKYTIEARSATFGTVDKSVSLGSGTATVINLPF